MARKNTANLNSQEFVQRSTKITGKSPKGRPMKGYVCCLLVNHSTNALYVGFKMS